MEDDKNCMDQHKRMANIANFAQIVVQRRKLAINYRRESGIEEQWREDQAFYDGEDNPNPGRMEKPSSMDGVLTSQTGKGEGKGSSVFLKITRPYVDAASARVADMLLPTDDRNFAFRPTPIAGLIDPEKMLAAMPKPEVVQAVQQPMMQQQGIPAMPGAQPGMSEPSMMGAPVAPISDQDQKLKEYEEAKARCERAQIVVDDWQTETNYHNEVRKMIETSARLGTGILKGPVPIHKTRKAAVKDEKGGWKIVVQKKTIPASFAINPWDFYPDPTCGENIQEGNFVFERDDLSARKLRELRNSDQGYIKENIDLCLKEGPIDSILGNGRPDENYKPDHDDRFQVWYYYGYVDIETMRAAGCDCEGADEEKGQYPCNVTMVNNHVIKINMSPLDSGEFPYDVMCWQRRYNCWYGEGIARQGRECQRGINAAVRNLMDNAGISAGPQIIVNRTKITPANGSWRLTPRKVWWTTNTGEEVTDVRDAFTILTIETRQAELLNIIQFFLKQMEDATGMPMLMQGQQGKAPDTVGGMTILNNNGNTVLRRIVRMFDYITECHQNRYYEWLLLHGPDEAKGDFTVDARGSSALMERDLQNQAVGNLAAASLNPAFGLDPEKVMEENIKGLRLDPKKLQLSAEKKAQMQSQPTPQDPRVQVKDMELRFQSEKLQLEDQQRQQEQQFAAAEAEKDRQLQFALKEIDVTLAGEELNAMERKVLNDAKVLLANNSMKLKVQRELSEKSMAHAKDSQVANHMVNLHQARQVTTPPTEPAGRAPNGEAFNA